MILILMRIFICLKFRTALTSFSEKVFRQCYNCALSEKFFEVDIYGFVILHLYITIFLTACQVYNINPRKMFFVKLHNNFFRRKQKIVISHL